MKLVSIFSLRAQDIFEVYLKKIKDEQDFV